MYEMRFNFIDLFRIPRLAFRAKKIWIHFRALVLGLVLYNVFTYAGAVFSGYGLFESFRIYYLFPPLSLVQTGLWSSFILSPWGTVLHAIGLVLLILPNYLALATVSKVTVEQLRGNDFYSASEAGAYTRRRWRAVVFTPIAYIVILAVLVGLGLLAGLVGKIPYVGELIAAFMTIPMYLGGLLFVFLIVVFVISLPLTPAIVGATGSDTFETSFELFSTLSAQPWRLLVYETLYCFVRAFATVLFGVVSLVALRVAFTLLLIPMGPKFLFYFASAWETMPAPFRALIAGVYTPGIELFGWFVPGYITATGPIGGFGALVATIFAVSMLCILGVVVSYSLSLVSTGQTVIYTVLRRKKDGENILEFFDADVEETLLAGEVTAGPAVEEKQTESEPERS
jgi:hypothetical protein